MATHLQQLLDTRLRDIGGLRTYVLAEHIRGTSWRAIARHLTAQTGIPVTDESLRDWYSDDARTARETAARHITETTTEEDHQ